MKATLRVTDDFFKKSMEIECSIRKDAEPERELLTLAHRKSNRDRIIKELRLSFGEARMELISYGRVIATGTISNNVFGGGGNITAKRCVPYAA